MAEVILYSADPWTEVTPNVYVGGAYKLVPDRRYTGGEMRREANPPGGFNLVISLAECGYDKPCLPFPTDGYPTPMHMVYPIPDGELSITQEMTLSNLARMVSNDGAHSRILIRCRAGKNRSVLVAALSMLHLGLKAEFVIERLRAARGAGTLSNEHFVRFIEAYVA